MNPSPPWRIEITDEAGDMRSVDLSAAEYLIGRASDAGIVLDRNTVSRRHARLWLGPSGWMVEDCGSRGGVRVDQLPIDQPTLLQHGSRLEISRFALKLIDPQAQAFASSFASDARSPSWLNADTDANISVLSDVVPPRLDSSHIAKLNDFGASLMQMPDPQQRMQGLCDVLCGDVMLGRWSMTLQLDQPDSEPPATQIVASSSRGMSSDNRHVSRTVIQALLAHGAPVLASNVQGSQASEHIAMSIVDDAPSATVVACPIQLSDAVTRLIYVNLPPAYTGTEWLALTALAVKQFEVAESWWLAHEKATAQAAHDRDIQSAIKIQQSILPGKLSDQRMDVAWSYRPCDAVGGDFVDVVPVDHDRVLLIIADVTGHGLQAALTTLSIHSIVHTCVSQGMAIVDMMVALNQHLCDYLPDGRFVTMVCLEVNLLTGEVLCVNAGHHPPVIHGGEGACRSLPNAEQLPLGILPGPFDVTREQLQRNELIFLLTDGLTELVAEDGAMLGADGASRLVSQAQATEASSADQVVVAISDAIAQQRQDDNALDDETFLIARWSNE